MNGISLAALLGASTWFGSKVADAAVESTPAKAETTAPDVREAPAQAPEEYEFVWPPNALFQ